GGRSRPARRARAHPRCAQRDQRARGPSATGDDGLTRFTTARASEPVTTAPAIADWTSGGRGRATHAIAAAAVLPALPASAPTDAPHASESATAARFAGLTSSVARHAAKIACTPAIGSTHASVHAKRSFTTRVSNARSTGAATGAGEPERDAKSFSRTRR